MKGCDEVKARAQGRDQVRATAKARARAKTTIAFLVPVPSFAPIASKLNSACSVVINLNDLSAT